MNGREINGRCVVITGGAGGIGRAAALLCAKRGDRVAIFDQDSEGVKETAEDALRKGAAAAIGLTCDVRKEKEVERAYEEVYAQFGAPYGIFANAGIDIGGLIHELPVEKWDCLLQTNLTGVFLVCKHGLRMMLKAKTGGSIVCTSSPASFVALGSGGTGAYSATKAGISSLVRCLAIDYARFGIRVNAVVPGATETGMMWNNVPPSAIAAMREQLHREIPLGRLAEPEDPARCVMWLLSNESSYVTGSHLVCDGGVLAKASISV
jgi:NAD(P)-dependent dehydrogenase (short-subunit alcohol dehydrogenase family)